MSPDLAAPLGMSLLLICSSIVSGSETALFSLRPAEIEQMSRQGSRVDELITWLLGRAQRLLLAILLANNVVNITYFAITGWWVSHQDGTIDQAVISISSLGVIILTGEILPKVLASANPPFFARSLSPLLYVLVIVLGPICSLVERLFPFVRDSSSVQSSEAISNEELKLVIAESHRQGVVSELAHDRLLEIIDLTETPVYQVMTHRVDCPMVELTADEEAAQASLRERPHPYMLVVDDERNEDCVGLLFAQDVLRGGKIRQRMRKPLFIPESALLPQAITLFQSQRTTVGVVVDEYGGTAGLLTLAHIGNALLGDGLSEDLPSRAETEQISEDTWRISGQMPAESWQSLLRDEDLAGCTTIGGFVTRSLGAVPEVGDRVLYRNLQFEVAAVRNHRVSSLLIRQLPFEEARRLSSQEAIR